MNINWKDVQNSLDFSEINKHFQTPKELFEYVGPIISRTVDPVINKIIGNSLIYYNIHIWSYKFGKRIGEYHLPSSIESDSLFRAMDAVFLTRTQRASYFRLFFCIPEHKLPFVLLRKPFKNRKSLTSYCFLPEEIFLIEEVREMSFLPLDNIDKLKELMSECMDFARKNANTPKGQEFWDSLRTAIKKGLGYDISLYENKEAIFEMFVPILMRRQWEGMYFIPANFLTGSGIGVSGLYIYSSQILSENQVKRLQTLTRLCFGKLAYVELIALSKVIKTNITIKEEVK